MITLPELAVIPFRPFECIAVASPCKCIVARLTPKIPSLELSWNTQFLNVADNKLPDNKDGWCCYFRFTCLD